MSSTRWDITRVSAPIPVHVPFELPISIPTSAINFLSKGDKLQPARRLPNWRSFYDGFANFRRSMALSLAFSNNNSEDPLRGLRKKFYKPIDLWPPGSNMLPSGFNRFCNNVLSDMAINLAHLKTIQDGKPFKHTKLHEGDISAIKRLRENRAAVIYVPTDKSLGPCIIPVGNYNRLAKEVLQKSFY